MEVTNSQPFFAEPPAIINEWLPPEILLKIFSYLDYPDQGCLTVCRYWKALVDNSSLEIQKIRNQMNLILLGKYTHTPCAPEKINASHGHCIRYHYLGRGQFYVIKGGNDYLVTLSQNAPYITETHVIGTGKWEEYREVLSLNREMICLKECSTENFLSVVDKADLTVSSFKINQLACTLLPQKQAAFLTPGGDLVIFSKDGVISYKIENSGHLTPLNVDTRKYVIKLAPNHRLFFIFNDKMGLFSLRNYQFVPMDVKSGASFFADKKCQLIAENNRLLAVLPHTIIELTEEAIWTKLPDYQETSCNPAHDDFIYRFDTYEHKIPKFIVKGSKTDTNQFFYKIENLKTGKPCFHTKKYKQRSLCPNDQGFFAYKEEESVYVGHIGLNKTVKIPMIPSHKLCKIVPWNRSRFIAVYENDEFLFCQATKIFFQVINIQ